MKAMILAAGRGERMRPLTDRCPKPLLPVAGKPLIVWHLERLAAAGFREVVINHAYLGEQIETALQDGAAWGLTIHYSPEPPGALDTAGGIAQALPLLGDAPFLVLSADVYCEWDIALARRALSDAAAAHLLLIANPPHHPDGDFYLQHGKVGADGTEGVDGVDGAQSVTFAGIAVYRPAVFAGVPRGKTQRLAPLLRDAMRTDYVSGECYTGPWMDVGTPQRLAELETFLRNGR